MPASLVVGAPTVAPGAAAPAKEKIAEPSPVTASENVSVQLTVPARLGEASTRLNDVTEAASAGTLDMASSASPKASAGPLNRRRHDLAAFIDRALRRRDGR